MAVSKATVLAALATFKGLQDSANADKFVAKEAGFSLISDADQAKLDGIASGAQINLIESITIDGVAQNINNKNVTLDLSSYVKGTDVASALVYRGGVIEASDLPSTFRKIGDVYNIKKAGGTDADGTAIRAGDNVVWNGTGWDVLAGTTDLSGYVQAEEGKGLSTNDFTDELKAKLETLDAVSVEYETITEAEIQALFVA